MHSIQTVDWSFAILGEAKTGPFSAAALSAHSHGRRLKQCPGIGAAVSIASLRLRDDVVLFAKASLISYAIGHQLYWAEDWITTVSYLSGVLPVC
jgi:hypothetical protein